MKNAQKMSPDNTAVPIEIPRAENPNGMTAAYGIKMRNQCFLELNNFIKASGGDYSKCLSDFDFNDEYCGGFNPDTQGLSNVNIIVILDASGSMAEKIGSVPKIDVAKKAVADLLIKMPKGVHTGLVVYGDKGSSSLAEKEKSCKGIEEVVKLGANNSNSIITAMDSFNPKGWTPIAGSLDFAENIFKSKGMGDKNYLILVSDGLESCDGDPLKSAENLKLEIPNIKLNVIGFTDDSKIQESLQKIAALGSGSYLTASDSSSIAKAFNEELIIIKEECLSSTLFKMYSRNNINNMNNLKCWLDAYKKESDNFSAKISGRSISVKCGTDISGALEARRNEFWFKKEALVEKNDAICKKIESDFGNQLKTLQNSKY